MRRRFLITQIKTLASFCLILILMTIFRVYFIFKMSPEPIAFSYNFFEVLWLGMRIDLSLVAYLYLPLHLIYSFFMFVYFAVNFEKIDFWVKKYINFIVILIFFIFLSNLVFYSYFGQHINILFFGIYDDDTWALLKTACQNYNIPFFLIIVISVLFIVSRFVKKLFKFSFVCIKDGFCLNTPLKITSFLIQTTILVFFMRGSFTTMFPITADIGDISPNKFLNSMTTNGILQLYKASIHYYESKQGTVDIIKETGYGENISQAFKDFTENAEVREDNFLENIKYQTKYDNNLEKNPPHVVLVMVESFGLPIIKYQSDSFDIMGSLKKHFEEDILFTNFISGGNGTADSLESLLLNFIQIPNSVSYGQSLYSQVSFEEAAAKVYQKMGYETTFVYGGDLSWRNVGNFISNQGFDHCIGKSSILKALNLKDDDTTSHPWGVFDELTYKHVNSLLKIAKKPQFIFVLTTNNHPPYVIPKTYKGNSLTIDDNLKKHLNGGEYSHKDR